MIARLIEAANRADGDARPGRPERGPGYSDAEWEIFLRGWDAHADAVYQSGLRAALAEVGRIPSEPPPTDALTEDLATATALLEEVAANETREPETGSLIARIDEFLATQETKAGETSVATPPPMTREEEAQEANLRG